MSQDLLIGILTGPTATGKTGLAIELAKKCKNIEIINADSMLVYREMNIGTAKPTLEEQSGIPHHLIDICNPDETFTAGEFHRKTLSAIENIHARGKRALIVGGTGFYLKAILFGLWSAPAADPKIREKLETKTNQELYQDLFKIDSDSALRIGANDRYRLIRSLELFELTDKTPTQLQADIPKTPNPIFRLWIIDRQNSELYSRIHTRTDRMLEAGLIEEFQKIHSTYPHSRALSSVGYSQVSAYLNKQSPNGRKVRSGLEGLADEIELATRQLVKSQRTWFRGQSAQVPFSDWFQLEEDRSRLEEAFNSVYT